MNSDLKLLKKIALKVMKWRISNSDYAHFEDEFGSLVSEEWDPLHHIEEAWEIIEKMHRYAKTDNPLCNRFLMEMMKSEGSALWGYNKEKAARFICLAALKATEDHEKDQKVEESWKEFLDRKDVLKK